MISKGFKPRTGQVIACAKCGIEVYKNPSRIREYGKKDGYFCSRKCHILLLQERAFRLNCAVCFKIFFCEPAQVKLRHRKTCSMVCRGKYQTLQANKRRETGIYTKHQMDRQARYCKEMKDARNAAFKRDDYTCQECRVRNGRGITVYLEADHIKPFAYFPESRYDVNNLRTLCKPCHNKTKMSAKAMRLKYLINENTVNQQA